MPNLKAVYAQLLVVFVLLIGASQPLLAMELAIGKNIQLGDDLLSA